MPQQDKVPSVAPKYVEEICELAKTSLAGLQPSELSLGKVVSVVGPLVQKAQTFGELPGPQKASVVLEGVLLALPDDARTKLEQPLRDALPCVLTLTVDAAKGKLSLDGAIKAGKACLPSLYSLLKAFVPCLAEKIQKVVDVEALVVRQPVEQKTNEPVVPEPVVPEPVVPEPVVPEPVVPEPVVLAPSHHLSEITLPSVPEETKEEVRQESHVAKAEESQ